MEIKSEEIARRLFIRLVDMINNDVRELHWRNARGKLLTSLRLSTSERWQQYKPWKNVFYLRMCFDHEGPAILAGIGSITKGHITLSIDLVPEQIRKLLNEKFIFSTIAVRQSFAEIKKESLPFYQSD